MPILQTVFENTLSGIINNLPWFILIYWVTKTIVREMPKWIHQYFKLRREEEAINQARQTFDNINKGY